MQIHTNRGTQLINIDGNLITNQQLIAISFNNYFLTVADKITSNIKNDKISLNCNNPKHCLHKNFKLPCSNMKFKYTTPKEISTPFITSPLTYTHNKSLSSGYFFLPIKIF